MLKPNDIDKRALKILKKYNLLAEYYTKCGYALDENEIKYMQEHCITTE